MQVPPASRQLLRLLVVGGREQLPVDVEEPFDVAAGRRAGLRYEAARRNSAAVPGPADRDLDSDGKLSFDEPVEELDIAQGTTFALPGVDDDKEPPRHSLDLPSITGTEPPPAFGLELLDSDSRLDPAILFADSSDPGANRPLGQAEDDINEDDDL